MSGPYRMHGNGGGMRCLAKDASPSISNSARHGLPASCAPRRSRPDVQASAAKPDVASNSISAPQKPGAPPPAPPLAKPGLANPSLQRPGQMPQGPPVMGNNGVPPLSQPGLRPAPAIARPLAPAPPPQLRPVAPTPPPQPQQQAPGLLQPKSPANGIGPGLQGPPSLSKPGPPPASVRPVPPVRPVLNRPLPPTANPQQRPGLNVGPSPPGRPTLSPGPAPGSPSSGASDIPVLRRPEAPTLRVLEPLMRPELERKQQPAQGQPQQQGRTKVEIVEEDDGTVVDDEFTDKKGAKKGRKGRKEKVTAEMRRAARKAREEKREEKAALDRKEREEIFEVGDEGMSLEALAEAIQVDPSDIVRALFMKGIALSMNQVLDKNTCKVVANEYDVLMVDREDTPGTQAKKRTEFNTDADVDDLTPRPPVVTVMGHVDHGKTSLLDHIRKARVAAGEAGGITQGIGAYNTSVEVDGEMKTICFLDTPGHEAFSAMRARGAQVTDVAIIIVAADDGVRPQTREAVAHAQAAEVPILVAINKVDKPGADVERVKQELLELNLVAEEWGGSTPMVPVSAKKGTGISDLLQMVSWMAEEKQLMANAKKPAQGTIIEAHLDKKVGAVATLLVQTGTLKVGDIVSAGASYGKVRSLRDDLGRPMESAGPSIAVQMIGLDSTPVAGEEWGVAPSESAAREQAEKSIILFKEQRMVEMTGGGSMVTLSSLATIDEDQEVMQKLNLVIKGDTVGVVEAIKSALGTLPQQSVTLRFLMSGAGDITVSDVDLAAASSAMVLGFNLSPDVVVEEHAKRQGVKIMTYKVIYDLIDDVKAAMEGKLRSVDEKVQQGKAEVKALFGSGKKKVAGCAVLTGKLVKGMQVCVRRGKKIVFEGKLSSLRRVKDLVDEVKEGSECGLGCEDFIDWEVGDQIECYQLVTKTRRLEDARATTAVDMATLV